ncbi:hypothetical protein A7P53_10230 [Acinetobacter defluvii]|uniref:Transferrin-binding protein-like solute binding protein n=1 Tax=Acinetobacter defluvii TaxID=1871111 RepID=A0A2S2FAY1_9GAMM|nr:hypothetical protein [Acinetobacter defluvii]AWL28109.1 hypothetical protein DJ533_05685 [Acinetobacter defluvii]NNP72946.1 hypothetical protein [Acinetobacter defluvii]
MKIINYFICLLLCVFLAACSKKQSQNDVSHNSSTTASADVAADAANNEVASDEKLGTKWGDEIGSQVTEVDLKRKSNSPFAETQVQYADKQYQGKPIQGISVAGGKISFTIIDDRGDTIPLYRVGSNYYLAGREGQSYQLHYENNTSKTFEIVTSVDGIDVIDGSAASRSNSGYVLHAHDTLTIEGFRKSADAVASFTFGKPEESYAANSDNGSIDNAGIIGTVVYELEAPEENKKPINKYAPPPNAFPADKD